MRRDEAAYCVGCGAYIGPCPESEFPDFVRVMYVCGEECMEAYRSRKGEGDDDTR